MKILILCREPRLYSCQRLKEAAESNGHIVDILDPNRFVLKLAQNQPHFLLYYQQNHNTELKLLSDYDAVIPRFGSASSYMGCVVLHHFQGKNIPCLNNGMAFEQARDKWRSLQLLQRQSINVPNSVFGGSEVSAESIVSTLATPTILKTLKGSQGIGVVLSESKKTTQSILETLKLSDVPVLLQEFIEEAQNKDIRCFVIGEQVIAAMERKGQNGEFRANCHRGGTAQQIYLTDAEKAIAIKATNILGLDVAGVDLIRAKNGLLVLEVNASPGLEMIEKTTGIDIALQMILHLEKLAQY
ncbi:RimK family alpha-L-glutamate ligase [Rodentibacter caecimuris]|uniref:Probable alpha-L-glutamate ligase n=1 Tax=Rodentibacter caecimuris TaxID=1796644 RepID=A0ABX3KVR1_9PAST|nr:ribosomal protein S6 modification protein [Rodentibacter heylii]